MQVKLVTSRGCNTDTSFEFLLNDALTEIQRERVRLDYTKRPGGKIVDIKCWCEGHSPTHSYALILWEDQDV